MELDSGRTEPVLKNAEHSSIILRRKRI